MATKDIQILRNFSHTVVGSFVRGEHRRLDSVLADMLIEGNLAVGCEHTHEGDPEEPTPANVEVVNEIIEVPDINENMPDCVIEQPKKTRKTRKKVDK